MNESEPVEVVEREAFAVVGVECREPPLIMYGWIALAARRHEIQGIVDPGLIYGVWHRTADHDGQGNNACLLGFEVDGDAEAPAGLSRFTVPACRFGVFEHRGHIGGIRETYGRIHEWVRARPKDDDASAPGVGAIEIYDVSQPLSSEYAFTILEPAP